MNCNQCGRRTKVLTTRHPHAPGNGWEVAAAGPPIDWYTFDFVVRRRGCVSCDARVFTVELVLEDIVGMMRGAVAGQAPENVVPDDDYIKAMLANGTLREILDER
mgnify:CR=1 FL=1